MAILRIPSLPNRCTHLHYNEVRALHLTTKHPLFDKRTSGVQLFTLSTFCCFSFRLNNQQVSHIGKQKSKTLMMHVLCFSSAFQESTRVLSAAYWQSSHLFLPTSFLIQWNWRQDPRIGKTSAIHRLPPPLSMSLLPHRLLFFFPLLSPWFSSGIGFFLGLELDSSNTGSF
jgi:hypothetical protein